MEEGAGAGGAGRIPGNPKSGLGAKLGMNGLVNAMFALQGDMLCSGPDTHWSLCFESLTVLVKITADDHCAEARAVLSTELAGGGRGRALGVRTDWWLVSTLTAPHSVEPLTELQHSSDNHQASTPGRAGDGDTGDRERDQPGQPGGAACCQSGHQMRHF